MRALSTILQGTILFLVVLSQLAQAQSEKIYLGVCEQNTVRAYTEFLERYPGSGYELDAYERLACCHTSAREWNKAAATYRHLGTIDPRNVARYDAIIAVLETPADTVVIRNLGPTVNTTYGEYAPVITADGRTLYFCSNDIERMNLDSIIQHLEGLPPLEQVSEALKVRNMLEESHKEEIWRTEYVNGSWSVAEKVGAPLNSKESDAMEAVSVDNTKAIIFRKGKLMTSELNSRGLWSSPVDMGAPINSGAWNGDACLSGDGRALFFVSSREGSIRDTSDDEPSLDIYVSVRSAGKWGKPVNLGSRINTPGVERTPFLHSDGRTLYFSSDGHPGLGGIDVFRTVRQGDSWTDWSPPENLGREINTPGNDWGYKLPASGDRAFYSAGGRSDGYGKQDIYVVELPTKVQPALAVTSIRGTITDRDGNPLQAKVLWEYLDDGDGSAGGNGPDMDGKEDAIVTIGEASSNPVTGEYHITLPAGRKYVYYASKEGYYPTSQNIDLRERREYDEHTVDIVLGESTIKLRNLFYGFDSSDLRHASRSELQRLVAFLRENPSYRIEIAGHTDDVGPDAYNKDLSERRAKSVVDYLVLHGISRSRLDSKGYGEERPVDTSHTEEGRAKNRRVEFRLLH